MISNKMKELVQSSSIIRAMFEEGKKMALQYGDDKVYDFSLGNPSVEPPKAVNQAIVEIVKHENPNLVHGYMNNSGYEDVRAVIADAINKRFGTSFYEYNLLMTVGAAGGLNVILKTLLNPGDEVVVFAPFFGEYRNYVSNFDGILTVVPPNTETFQPNLAAFETLLNPETRAVIVNTPNNPTGVIYSEETIRQLAAILTKKSEEYGNPIYLISDEPYRELAYDGLVVPYLTKYYDDTIVAYSFSKSMSLPGERIGYLVLPSALSGFEEIAAAANTANRILGYVNAPSLMQRAVARCMDAKVDLEAYNQNRELLYHSLKEYGFECIKPEGAFYMFVKAMEEDEFAFVAKAKQFQLLLVPGSSFGCPGYVRIAYCVDHEMIKRSLPAFRKLAELYHS